MAVAAVAALIGPTPGPASALTAAPSPASTTVTVRSGPDNQTDPHVSGSLVSYTNFRGSTGEIRYQDLATGADAAIPNGGHRDELSDVSGTTIVFRRVHLDGSTTTRPIMAFDTATGGPAVELDPQPGARRTSPEIGGRTVAWVEFVPDSNTASNVVVYDLDTQLATPLSHDEDRINTTPAVSPDGSVVTWAKCDITNGNCDIHVVTKAGGTWAATAVTGPTGEDVLPDTNGELVVYATNASGDVDITWKTVDGTGEQSLRLPGSMETRPKITGSLVSFERDLPNASNSDLWLYDLATDTLYQLTDTPAVDETLNDISVSDDGLVRVVWAQADGTATGSNDVYAMSFRLDANQPPDCTGGPERQPSVATGPQAGSGEPGRSRRSRR